MSLEKHKQNAIFSYITIIGFLYVHFANKKSGSDLVSYHLKQSAGLNFLLFFAFCTRLPLLIFVGSYTGDIIWILFLISVLVLFAFGLVYAIKEETKPVPVFGLFFEKIFVKLF